MKWFLKTEQMLTRLLEAIIVICFLGILLLVITLVFMRYGFNATIIGANELVVIMFIYTSAIGAAIIIGKNEHISITYFIDKLTPNYRKWVDIFNYLLIAVLNAAMIFYSIRWISLTGNYLTAVLRIPQYYAQIIVPIGAGIAIFYCISQIIKTLIEKRA